MSVWRRASLYLARNKKKSILLLAILTVITTLVLTCVSVGNAAGASIQRLREQMGGYFKLEMDASQGKTGWVSDEIMQEIMGLGGIKAFNGMDIQYLTAEDLELEPGRFAAEGGSKAKLARFLGNTDSSLNEYFILEYYSLTEGRHIAPGDVGKAVISDALAERNQLSLGDTFSAKYNEEYLTDEQKEQISSHALEIVGIYHIDYPQGYRSADTAECDIEENFIFTDTEYLREVYGEAMGGTMSLYNNGAAFFVENPKELDGIMGRMLASDICDWEEFAVVKNNKTYEDSAAPLERLSGLVTMMVAVIAVVSAVMLSLILFLWMRERVHEIGIYLSIGIRKMGILRQHILENLVIAAAAFLLAWGISTAASGVTEQIVGSAFSEESAEEETPKQAEDSGLEVRVGAAELMEIAGMGLLLILLSTGVSSVTVLRMQPKDILSKMS